MPGIFPHLERLFLDINCLFVHKLGFHLDLVTFHRQIANHPSPRDDEKDDEPLPFI
jgi:hypothetical protein